MFYSKYLDDYYLNEVFENYDINFLKSIDEENFKKVYQVFKDYNFDYIEDIIENYLEIFTLDSKLVENKIILLKEKLGNDYVNIIGDDMSYLEEIIK